MRSSRNRPRRWMPGSTGPASRAVEPPPSGARCGPPGGAAAIHGALEAQALDDARAAPVRSHDPHGPLVPGLLRVDLLHAGGVPPVSLVGRAEREPCAVGRPGARGRYAPEARDLPGRGALRGDDEELERFAVRKGVRDLLPVGG